MSDIKRVPIPSEDGAVDLAAALSINLGDINASFIDQAPQFAYWAAAVAQAKSRVDRLSEDIKQFESNLKDVVYSRLDTKYREWAARENRKATEGQIAAQCKTDPDYLEGVNSLKAMRAALLEEKERLGLLEVAKAAFEQRKDMLISLGANLRAEQNADVAIRRSVGY